MQLPPVCEMNFDEKQTDVTHYPCVFWQLPIIYCENILGLPFDILYHQFVNSALVPFENLPFVSLSETFRFGQKLADSLSKFVYDPIHLISCSDEDTEIIVIDAPRLLDEPTNRGNRNEANAIRKYIPSLTEDINDIAVLTPYNDQIKLLNSQLPLAYKENIMTVHKSQGQEWDTVVFSAVDTTNKWFTTSRISKSGGKQVLNTAISRAKKRLVIVCDYEHWLNQPRELLGEIVANADRIIR